VRAIYQVILTSHMTLAAAVVPLVLRTLYLVLTRRFDAHPRIARVTFPICSTSQPPGWWST
jgi:putative membrane protein